LFGVSFHTWTFLVLLVTLVVDFYAKRLQGMKTPKAMVHSAAVVTFTIHFYEALHAFTEYAFTGFLSKSVWFNLLFMVATFWVINRIERTWCIYEVTTPLVILLLLVFQNLGATTFFVSGCPKTWLWASSKLVTSLFTTSIFMLPGGVPA